MFDQVYAKIEELEEQTQLILFDTVIPEAQDYVAGKRRPFFIKNLDNDIQENFQDKGIYIFYDVASMRALYVGTAGADGMKGENTLVNRIRGLLKFNINDETKSSTHHALAAKLLAEKQLLVHDRPIQNQLAWHDFLKKYWGLKIMALESASFIKLMESSIFSIYKTPLNNENILDKSESDLDENLVKFEDYRIKKWEVVENDES